MACETPSLTKLKRQDLMGEELEVQIDMKNGYIVKAKEMFVYKHDPWIAQVYPLSTFLM